MIDPDKILDGSPENNTHLAEEKLCNSSARFSSSESGALYGDQANKASSFLGLKFGVERRKKEKRF